MTANARISTKTMIAVRQVSIPAHEPPAPRALMAGVAVADAVEDLVRVDRPGPVPGRDVVVRMAPVAGERRDPARVSRDAPVVAEVRDVVGLDPVRDARGDA